MLFQQTLIEVSHQLRGGPVIDIPECRNDPGRACIHEPAGEADEPLTFDLASKRCLAGAQDDEIRPQRQAENLVQPDQPVTRPAVLVNRREYESRQLRMYAVEETVRREMKI